MAQLQDLTDRLVAAPLTDKSGSWIGSKMARPSLDKIGNWLEGRFTSFIAGEGDSPKPGETNGKAPTYGGPFAHFSTISSTTPSAMSSPQMSAGNLPDTQLPAPPFRTGSAMALRTSTTSPAQIARASSAIDYLRYKPSPANHVSPIGASVTSGSPSKLQVPYGYPSGYPSLSKPDLSTPTAQEDSADRLAGPQVASWWGDQESVTPTATSFSHPDQEPASGGFISLMDAPSVSESSSSTNAQFTAAARMQTMSREDIDEEDDLGLGNSTKRAKAPADAPAEPEKKAAAPAAATPEKAKEPEKPGEFYNLLYCVMALIRSYSGTDWLAKSYLETRVWSCQSKPWRREHILL
jgi:COPII coat assembly protein SEC16